MGYPNYIFCIVVVWFLIYLAIYYTVLKPDANEQAASIDNLSLQKDSVLDSIDTLRDVPHVARPMLEDNSFLSNACVDYLSEHATITTPFKSAVVVIVAKDVKPAALLKTVPFD